MNLDGARRRATPYAAAQLAAARKIVQPYQSYLAEWNSQFALLRATQNSSHASDVSLRAGQLVRRISEVQSSLQQELRLSDDAVARHSLVLDLDRAMSHLVGELEKLASAPTLPR
jgi:3-methyladenine DNA glycosylase/8-oxoguanine DNA glycosylase